jgi:hypothetical protein
VYTQHSTSLLLATKFAAACCLRGRLSDCIELLLTSLLRSNFHRVEPQWVYTSDSELKKCARARLVDSGLHLRADLVDNTVPSGSYTQQVFLSIQNHAKH